MSPQAFREAGLHKLNEEELARLDQWILDHSPAEDQPVPASAPSHAIGLPRNEGPIRTRIVGGFSGWSGPTEFTMADGSVWQTTESRTFHTRALENPGVILRQRAFGSGWQMQVEGYNTRVNIRRVK